MAPTAPANHDPALSHAAPAAPSSQPSQALPQNITPGDIPGLQLDQNQIMNLLRSLPGVFTKVSEIAGFFLFLLPCMLASSVSSTGICATQPEYIN